MSHCFQNALLVYSRTVGPLPIRSVARDVATLGLINGLRPALHARDAPPNHSLRNGHGSPAQAGLVLRRRLLGPE